jgi:hypothetical protein
VSVVQEEFQTTQAAAAEESQTQVEPPQKLTEVKTAREQPDGVPELAPQPTRPAASFQTRLQRIVNRGPLHGLSKTLVIRSTDTSPAQQANLEEDLAVMSHILAKAVDENVDGAPRGANVLGIDVSLAPSVGSLRGLYLEGYGALFLLNVDFPLLPPAVINAHRGKAEADSPWETARRELYGTPLEGMSATVLYKAYDEEKVNKLKTSLLDSIKNASNIRGLKDNETITVCLVGGAGREQIWFKTTPKASGGGGGASGGSSGSMETRNGPARQSVLTLRVKKEDVDAFAKGKLSRDEFQKRAQMSTYTVSSDGAGAGSFGGAGFGGRTGGGGFGGGFGGSSGAAE